MAWTTPRTWSTGEVVTAALLNAQIKANMDLTAPAVMTTAGDIIYASGANTPVRLAKDANATRYLSNTGTSNVPAWAQVNITNGVTGTLPVGSGGTGATTLTDGGVLLGNGTGAVVAMAVLADGEMIVGDGTTDPVAESGATLRTSIGVGTGDAVTFGGLTLGSDGSGVDAIFYSGTAGDNMTWDASEEVLNITGTDGATALDVLDGDVRIVDKLYFYDRGGEYISSNGSLMTLTGNVTVSGDLTVSGTTTTVNSTVTTIADPLVIYSVGSSGSASKDAGFVVERGDDTNVGFFWDESADEFVAVTTGETGTTAGNVSITAYADIHGKDLVVGALLDANGTVDADVTDFDVASSGDIDLVSSNDSAAAVYIAESGSGTSGTIKIHADTGTSVTEGAASVSLLSDVGGVELRSTANLANAINITSDGGSTGSITIFNDQGTSATEGSASIQLLSDVGGINIKSGLNGAGAVLITADGGANETIQIHADQGTGDSSIELVSDAGGITLNVADGKSVRLGGSTVFDDEVVVTYNASNTTVDTTKGNKFILTMTGDITNLYFTPPAGSGVTANMMLKIVHSGAGRSVTNWYETGTTEKIHTAGGAEPSLTDANGAVDVMALYWDGASFHMTSSLDSKAYS